MTIDYQNTLIGLPIQENKEKINSVLLADAGFIEPIVWDCIIPYKIDSNIIHPNIILEAIEYVSIVTNYSFKEKTNEKNYIKFIDGDGCYTTLGKGLSQLDELFTPTVEVIISRYCDKFAIVHEIGHILGLSHTMKRDDRDNYLTIHEENIIDDKKNQYKKDNILVIGDFDIKSNMMYDRFSFNSNEKPTFDIKNPLLNRKIGERSGFSIDDVKNINNKAYSKKCPQKSKPPPCEETDIRFFGTEKVNVATGPNGIYYKVSDNLYEGYNIYDDKKFTIVYTNLNKRWEIICNNQLYAYSNSTDLYDTKGWYLYYKKEFILFPESIITKRGCEWPDLSNYHKDVSFNLWNFMTTNIVTIAGIFFSLIILILIIYFVVSGKSVKPILKNIRSKSLDIFNIKSINSLRRKTF